ncbi:unnamed protein product [Mytilus coruscus]|uniref:E3 ubiquitin-protein ligase RNF182 n=1 Tax=Mytilus coruscus TaxID=42192 RepID=A0A6J8BJX4_MYTCO|nr:unnamed protein product [Mytilus coruscus]
MSENEKTCDLCYEDFDRENHEPRKLPCCHTYCSQCLDRMVLRNASITCPNDRSIHTLGGLGVFGLPLDSSKLADIDKREVTSPVGSINFSSDFVDPPRPTTAWSYRQAQNHVNSNQLPAHREPYITPQSTGYNYQPRSYPNMSYNYNTQFHCFPHILIHSQHIAPSGWHSPYQWSYHFNNTNQFHPPMMTTATTVTHGGNNGQNIIMSSPGGQIVISQGGNNQSINLFHF